MRGAGFPGGDGWASACCPAAALVVGEAEDGQAGEVGGGGIVSVPGGRVHGGDDVSPATFMGPP